MATDSKVYRNQDTGFSAGDDGWVTVTPARRAPFSLPTGVIYGLESKVQEMSGKLDGERRMSGGVGKFRDSHAFGMWDVHYTICLYADRIGGSLTGKQCLEIGLSDHHDGSAIGHLSVPTAGIPAFFAAMKAAARDATPSTPAHARHVEPAMAHTGPRSRWA
jgi:hypothetical protein